MEKFQNKYLEIKNINKDIVNWVEDVAEENRARGVSLANDICKSYRREGKFFDEILDEAINEV